MSVFALSRLGYTPLCFSLRIPPPAILNLLRLTGCHILIHGSSSAILEKVAAVVSQQSTNCFPIPVRQDYEVAGADLGPRFERSFDREVENLLPALIMHSSGSTGLPKPVTLSHRALLTHALQGSGMDNCTSNSGCLYLILAVSRAFESNFAPEQLPSLPKQETFR